MYMVEVDKNKLTLEMLFEQYKDHLNAMLKAYIYELMQISNTNKDNYIQINKEDT